MYKWPCLLFSFLTLAGTIPAQERQVNIKLVQTSDVHGAFYPYDFIRQQPADGGLARVASYVREQRARYGENLLLLENGDILQGQPSAYYYNYIDTTSVHLTARMLNFMGYDAGNMGNHDVETGHAVFDRWASQCRFPVLGANVVEQATGLPHFKPYEVLVRDGVKVVVLGMITPAIPVWLSENLWSGLRFEDMERCARHWMQVIREKEHPDVVVGLFHAGAEAETLGKVYRENASLEVAQRVPGFDVVLIGHDHRAARKVLTNEAGAEVLVLDPGSNALQVCDVDITVTLQGDRVVDKQVKGKLTSMKHYAPDPEFVQAFQADYDTLQQFVQRKIGYMEESISTREAYFGSSAFIDLIHTLQLQISGAQISLTAPLSFDARIERGDIRVSDMFNLYKYENMLYTMRLTGQEVKDALEMSYALWSNRMQTADDPLLLLTQKPLPGSKVRTSFTHFSFNFDSAAGIRYTVDVTKPQGERVCIESMADGTPFSLTEHYLVAVNSYRGNGGGNLLTEGAGIPQEELKHRIVASTDKDLRYYLMQYIEQHPHLAPQPLGQWRFVPEEWTVPAAARDYKLLFEND